MAADGGRDWLIGRRWSCLSSVDPALGAALGGALGGALGVWVGEVVWVPGSPRSTGPRCCAASGSGI